MPSKHSSPQVNGDLTLPFDISVAKSTPTQTRIPSIRADGPINRISTARANAAVSTASPEGDKGYTRRFKYYTVLQQHVLFWDKDADGQIYTGFRELGFNIIFSLLAAGHHPFGLLIPDAPRLLVVTRPVVSGVRWFDPQGEGKHYTNFIPDSCSVCSNIVQGVMAFFLTCLCPHT